MIDLLGNWWRSYQFCTALKVGDRRRAKQILQEIEKSGAKLSRLEQLFKQQLKFEETSSFYQQEVTSLSRRLQAVSDSEDKLKPNAELSDRIYRNFKLIQHDQHKLQCTGIEENIFNNLEASLVNFLETEFSKIPPDILEGKIQEAIEDLEGLKQGIDPTYNSTLSPHVYFMKYFLENVYSAYIAWFLIYETGLIPKNIKILDIAAGVGTVNYGLTLFLQTGREFFPVSQMHISYHSLEQQAQLQYRGLQFWRKYIESEQTGINAYFLFNTADIFDYDNYSPKLPESFFDFIVVSHCFFYEPQQRKEAHKIYRQIFQNNLADRGHILLIIQGRKLFSLYDTYPSEDIGQEQIIVHKFVEELGLQLEWYKYLTSTDTRIPMKNGFGKYARENLPELKHMNRLKCQYLGSKSASRYVLDDYVILARN